MQIRDAIGEALETIRTQKLKSFFSLLGVLIGVTFLIAVVSIVQGMNVYMEDQFANRLVGLNTFQLRRMPNFNSGNVTDDMWREWQRRPRINYTEAAAVTSIGSAASRTTAAPASDDARAAYPRTPLDPPDP